LDFEILFLLDGVLGSKVVELWEEGESLDDLIFLSGWRQSSDEMRETWSGKRDGKKKEIEGIAREKRVIGWEIGKERRELGNMKEEEDDSKKRRWKRGTWIQFPESLLEGRKARTERRRKDKGKEDKGKEKQVAYLDRDDISDADWFLHLEESVQLELRSSWKEREGEKKSHGRQSQKG